MGVAAVFKGCAALNIGVAGGAAPVLDDVDFGKLAHAEPERRAHGGVRGLHPALIIPTRLCDLLLGDHGSGVDPNVGKRSIDLIHAVDAAGVAQHQEAVADKSIAALELGRGASGPERVVVKPLVGVDAVAGELVRERVNFLPGFACGRSRHRGAESNGGETSADHHHQWDQFFHV